MRTEVTYIAKDGKRFLTESACREHESSPACRVNMLEFFYVGHAPDLTEGRGFPEITLIAIESSTPTKGYLAEQFVQCYCFQKFGLPVALVQGVAPTEGWKISPFDEDRFHKYNPETQRTIHRVFLSNGEALEGFPPPTPPPYPNR